MDVYQKAKEKLDRERYRRRKVIEFIVKLKVKENLSDTDVAKLLGVPVPRVSELYNIENVKVGPKTVDKYIKNLKIKL